MTAETYIILLFMPALLALMLAGYAVTIAAVAARAALRGQNIREAIKPLTDEW